MSGVNGWPPFLPVSGQRSRQTDSTERRPKWPVPTASCSLHDQQITNHHVGIVVQSGKKMALNQRTANRRLCWGKHVQAHVRLNAAQRRRSGLCSHQGEDKRKTPTFSKARRSSSAATTSEIFHEWVSVASGVCYAESSGKKPWMEGWWFLMQMRHGLVFQDPIRGHISH